MATCLPAELVESGKCYEALTTKQVQIVIISLLCKILQAYNAMATCDAATLLDDAKCFATLTTNQMQAVQIQLLCEILYGGATGTSCIVCVDGDETPTDAATCDCSIAYNQQGQFWFWHSLSSAWVPFIV